MNIHCLCSLFSIWSRSATRGNYHFKHDLRHSAATLLLKLQTNPKIVQEILGHSNIGITLNIYSHVLPTMQENAMQSMNTWLLSHFTPQLEGGKAPKIVDSDTEK